MKISICQINTTIGDFQGNLDKILAHVKLSHERGADLVVFPELAICGYPPRDLLEKPLFIKKNEESLKKLSLATDDIGVIIGYAASNPDKRGKGVFNNAALIHSRAVLFKQAKTHLPTYDVFDESRHFDSASSHSICEFKSKKIGIAICEDIWTEVEFDGRKFYYFDPLVKLKDLGAEIIIAISASPYALDKQILREEILRRGAQKIGLPIVYCNSVGGNDELVFDGRSMVVDSKGNLCAIAKSFCEEDLFVDSDELSPLREISEIKDEEDLINALSLGLKDYLSKCGFERVIIGISGGIDSALVAAIACRAIGKDRVLGVLMPSPYTSKESITDAEKLAKNLGIELRNISITKPYESLRSSLERDSKFGIVDENLQARIRGNILMAISNDENRLLLSTGNKSELAVGYCTLYGDMAGGLALISDLPKTWVYKLSRFLNRDRILIPPQIIEKAPSAELRPNQKDSDELPDYDTLDKILKAYIEDKMSEEAIAKLGFDKKVVESIVRKVDMNEFKRRQASIGIKVTSKAFGSGRRFPIAYKFR